MKTNNYFNTVAKLFDSQYKEIHSVLKSLYQEHKFDIVQLYRTEIFGDHDLLAIFIYLRSRKHTELKLYAVSNAAKSIFNPKLYITRKNPLKNGFSRFSLKFSKDNVLKLFNKHNKLYNHKYFLDIPIPYEQYSNRTK